MKAKCNRFLILVQGARSECVFITLIHVKNIASHDLI